MQSLDLLFALLPVAAASGWYAAKQHYTKKYLTDFANPLTQAYRRGLNYLLDEKTDKAIAAVAHILKQDAEPLETHIALGNLFRRRGEVEKAIEIHERLFLEPGLSSQQKDKVNFELGMDYMRAGLYDRAESIFQSLSQTPQHGRAALQQILLIYQQQKDWHKAIDCTLRLRRIAKPRRGETVAHFLCELAEEAMSLHRLKDARDFLVRALQDDPNCVRASMTKGKLELSNGEYRQALATLRQVEIQNPRYLPVVLPLIRQCWERLGNERDLTRYLQQLHEDLGVISAAVELAENIRCTQGISTAMDFLLPILEANPDPLAISRALTLLAEEESPGSGKMRRLCILLQGLMAGKLRFQCEHCGFSVSELYWRCPSCQYWASIMPLGYGSIPAARPEGPVLVN